MPHCQTQEHIHFFRRVVGEVAPHCKTPKVDDYENLDMLESAARESWFHDEFRESEEEEHKNKGVLVQLILPFRKLVSGFVPEGDKTVDVNEEHLGS